MYGHNLSELAASARRPVSEFGSGQNFGSEAGIRTLNLAVNSGCTTFRNVGSNSGLYAP
jgi:hypothetical protein